jgi:arginine-tRNA-protein transferase
MSTKSTASSGGSPSKAGRKSIERSSSTDSWDKITRLGGSGDSLDKRGQKKSGKESTHTNFPEVCHEGDTHTMTIETVPAENTKERYELYRKYQIHVHGDDPSDVSRDGFQRFLVDSPLIHSPVSSNMKAHTSSGPYKANGNDAHVGASSSSNMGTSRCDQPRCGGVAEEKMQKVHENNHIDGNTHDSNDIEIKYGTYHQLYRVNKKLIAVGVVDLLPSGLSSVYMYYDVDYRQLVLGKLTALKEIEFCERYNMQYYYMGFYIHSW